jgi:hypothetical protein
MGQPRRNTTIKPAFDFGDTVFLRLEMTERCPGFVTGMTVRPGGLISYEVTWTNGCTDHYEFELTTEWVQFFNDQTEE